MYVDAHNHLKNWSPDAIQSPEQLIRDARQNGLFGIGISDHYDLGSLDCYGSEWTFHPDEYFAAFMPYRHSIAKRGNREEPGFLIGIEIGYRPGYEEKIQEVLTSGPYDNVILSIHMIDEYDPYHHREEVYGRPLPELYRYFLRLLHQSVSRFPEVSTLGHYDYICRYAPGREIKILYRPFADEFDLLFRYLIEHGIALEINTGTVDALLKKGYSPEEAMPDPDILCRYRELGGELLTLTTDSHRLSHHMRHISATIAYLKSRGISRLCYFEDKQAHFYEI